MVNCLVGTEVWGTLLQDPETARLFSAERVIAKMIAFERAWTQALFAVGDITSAEQKDALAAIDAHVPNLDALASASVRDGLPVPELVSQLRSTLNPQGEGAIHTGATSQDVIDTSMVLILLEALDLFDARLKKLLGKLAELSTNFEGCPLMGRTRMQAALPITVEQRIESWRAPLEVARAQLAKLKETLSAVQAGGPVGSAAFERPERLSLKEALAKELGLSVVPVWHTDRSRMLAMGAWLTQLSGACGKLGADMLLMAQTGIDEVTLTGGGGSSAMPHKSNPVLAETLPTLARYIAGLNGVLGQAMLHEQERSGQAWMLEWLTLPAMCEATGTALNAANRLVNQVERLGKGMPHS